MPVGAIVRRRSGADGTLDNDTALLVNGLGVGHPAVIRSVAAAEGSMPVPLSHEKRDTTHRCLYGATAYAGSGARRRRGARSDTGG